MYVIKVKYIYAPVAKQNKGNFHCETDKTTSLNFPSFPLGGEGSLHHEVREINLLQRCYSAGSYAKPHADSLKNKDGHTPEYIFLPCELVKFKTTTWSETEGRGNRARTYSFHVK